VERALDQLRPGLSGVNINTSVFRPATYVRDGLHNLAVALAAAAALLLLALVVLRRLWRTVLVSLVAICVSLLAAATVLDLLGYSFNALTFAGFGVAVAVLLDVALSDSRQTRDSIGFGALIALVVAAPFFLARGTTGSFIHPGVLAYGLAVLASLIVALTLTPALGSLLAGIPAPPRRPRAGGLGQRARSAYRRRLEILPRLPRLVAIAICIPGLALLAIAPALGEPQRPTFKDRDLLVRLDGRPGVSLPEMDRIAGRTAMAINQLPGTEDVSAAVGRAVSSGEVGESGSAQLWVSIKPGADYASTLEAIRGLASGVPGVASSLETYESDRSSGVLSRPSDPTVVRIYGQDYGVLARSAGEVRRAIAGIPGARGTNVVLPQQEPTLQIRVDLQNAQRHDIKPGDVRRSVTTLLSGLTVGNFFQQQKVFDVVVRGTGTTQNSVASVRNLLIDTPGGGHVRLAQMASVGIAPNPIDITHDAVSRFVDVEVNVGGGDAGAVRAAIQRQLAQLHFPLEYHAELLATSTAAGTSATRFLSYLIAAALAVFLLLQTAFSSWRLAAVVFATLPLATIGGILAALAVGEQSSLGAAGGLLAVLVVAARQALALGMSLGRLEHKGTPGHEPTLEAAAERFGPTVESLLVVAIVALPFVLMGGVAGNEILHPMAVVIVGGMVSTALLTLLITPMACLSLRLRPACEAVPRITRARPPEVHPQGV
jgi:Cu/Ag efflux pump CusA